MNGVSSKNLLEHKCQFPERIQTTEIQSGRNCQNVDDNKDYAEAHTK